MCISVAYSHHIRTKVLWRLNDGNYMPGIGFGTWLGSEKQVPGDTKIPDLVKVTSDSMEKAVESAIDEGYRLIDTASIYFTEEQVGRAIQKKLKEGFVKREDLFITTKLWNDKHAAEDVIPALRDSLERLKLDYVDLYLIHWPISMFENFTLSDVDYLDTWKALIEAKNLGLVKSIGVANFNQPQLERLIRHSEVKPSVLQVEVNLNSQQNCLREFAKKHDIIVMGYTPFGSLFPSKATCLSPPPRIDDPKMVDLANKYRVTVPQITLRYLHELGVVPIPKAEKIEHIRENFNIFEFKLKDEDKEFLKDYDRNYKTLNIAFWKESPYFPY
ncbi:unnamed protein product, partial [Brenthis ino]